MSLLRPSARGRRFYAAWYFCISLGFVLLAIRAALLGARPLGVALRFVIAAGFLLLGWLTIRQPGR